MRASSLRGSEVQYRKQPVRAAAVPAIQGVRVSAKLPLVGCNQLGTVLGARRGLEVEQLAVAADQEIWASSPNPPYYVSTYKRKYCSSAATRMF